MVVSSVDGGSAIAGVFGDVGVVAESGGDGSLSVLVLGMLVSRRGVWLESSSTTEVVHPTSVEVGAGCSRVQARSKAVTIALGWWRVTATRSAS